MTTYNVVSPSAMVAGQPEDISVVLANFNAIASVLNGGIDNANINAAAAIAKTKLAALAIVNADVDAAAAIAVSKLAAGTNTHVLTTTGGVPVWAAPGGTSIPRGTSLPGSPSAGDEYILVDSLTAPTYSWHFRYDSGITGSYKWECIGGGPAIAQVATNENTTATTYGDLTTVGPSITVPRAGEYLISQGAFLDITAGLPGSAYMSFAIGAAAAAEANRIEFVNSGTTGVDGNLSRTQQITCAASDALVSKYKVNSGDTCAYKDRWLSVVPLRVS